MNNVQIHGESPIKSLEDNPELITLDSLKNAINLSYSPMIEDLYSDERANQVDLNTVIQEKFKNIAEGITTYEIDSIYREIDFIFKCFICLNNTSDLDPVLLTLKENLSSFSNVTDKYLSAFSEREINRALSNPVNWAKESVHPSQVLEIIKKTANRFRIQKKVPKSKITRSRDAAKIQEWVLFQENNNSKIYTTQQILEEFKAEKDRLDGFYEISYNYLRPKIGYTHTTTSASLNGIAEYKGLIRRTELLRRGNKVESGEIANIDQGVMAQRGVINDSGYGRVRWFNEFPITIEINPELQSSDTLGVYYGERNLGEEVPITEFKRIWCHSQYMGIVSSWSEQNDFDIRINSFEAYDLLTHKIRG